MLKFFNATLVLGVLFAGYFLYALEHDTRGAERGIAKAENKLDETREAIKLLNAEWSSLTRPERIQKLAEQYLSLEPAEASQFVGLAELAARVPDSVPVMLEKDGKDPIGDILKQMQ